MKYINLIKLLSVLLCMVMLLTACNNGKTEETTSEQTTEETTETTSETATEQITETERPDDVYVEVAPEFDNFIKFEYEIDWQELSDVKRVDDIIDIIDNFAVIRDATLDNEGTVTEIYKVLDLITSNVVLEKSHQYKYRENYDIFDWNYVDALSNYLESVMYVDLIDLDYTYIIHVAHAEFTVTEEETLCDGTAERVYETNFTHEYYDMSGAMIVATDSMEYGISIDYSASSIERICLRCGVKKMFIDTETGLLISTVNENQAVLGNFDYENDRYGYFFDNYSNTGINDDTYYFEVYRKFTGELKRYYLSSDWQDNECIGVLKNGDVVVQLRCEVPDEKGVEYDVLSGEIKYDLKTYIYDVSEGECREIDLNYMLEAVYEQEKFYEMFHMEKSGVSFTDKAWNVAVAYPVKNKKVESASVVVFNDCMDVIFELDPIAPDHYISVYQSTFSEYWSLGMKVLKNGDILIDVGTYELTDFDRNYIYYAIVTSEGEVRCYLPEGYSVVGECIVSDKNMYDFDMKPIFSFEDEEMTVKGVIGEKIIVSKTVVEWERIHGETFQKVEKTEYYALSVTDGAINKTRVFEDEMLAEMDYGSDCIAKDYVITCSEDLYNGIRKYTLYNADLEQLLTAHGYIYVYPMEEGYLVTFYIGETEVAYTVR